MLSFARALLIGVIAYYLIAEITASYSHFAGTLADLKGGIFP